MPSKRSTNETNRQTRKNKKGSSQDISSRYEAPESLEFISEDPQVGAVKNDLCGVVLAVIALTMFISLISTTEAPVTYAIGQVLTLGFGAGAMLVPLALFLFALTFFMVSEKPLSNRVALGLTLIVLAILSLLSISIEGADRKSVV